jgi:hypothetical protein
MAKLLVANGCSFTRGEELPDPEARAWPARLADRLGVPCVNLARNASSNRRIVRSTVMRLEAVRREHGLRPEDVTVVIAWTQTARHEYHSAVEPVPQEGPPDHPVDAGWHRVGPWLLGRGHKPTKAFYDMMWSEEGQLVNFFVDWTLLHGHLAAHGYDARYAFAFPITDPIPAHAKPLMDALDADRVWGGLPAPPERSFVNMPPRFTRGPGGHPLEAGHAWFADALGDWINPR